MNLARIALAAIGAFVAYFALGGVMFAMLPTLKNQFMKYPAVYRSQEGIKRAMPTGMLAMLVGMVVLAALYAMLYHGDSGLAEGARLGAHFGAAYRRLRDLRLCRAQLGEPEHRADADHAAGGCLLH
jgi:hypothetical protein